MELAVRLATPPVEAIRQKRWRMKSTNAATVGINKREFLDEVGAILEIRPNTLQGPEALGSHGWDSMSVIAFQAFLDQRFGMTVECARTAACETFDELFALTVTSAHHEPAESEL
jgi:hypothetical protein